MRRGADFSAGNVAARFAIGATLASVKTFTAGEGELVGDVVAVAAFGSALSVVCVCWARACAAAHTRREQSSRVLFICDLTGERATG
jgi:hypothetical protein